MPVVVTEQALWPCGQRIPDFRRESWFLACSFWVSWLKLVSKTSVHIASLIQIKNVVLKPYLYLYLVFSKANRPMQFLFPFENGMKAYGCLSWIFSGRKFSGLNCAASEPQ